MKDIVKKLKKACLKWSKNYTIENLKNIFTEIWSNLKFIKSL